MDNICHCGGKLRIKDHGSWEGYYCGKCGSGGSRQKKGMTNRRFVQFKKFFRQAFQQELIIDVRPDFYHKEKKSFCFECSDVDIANPTETVILHNPNTNGKMTFTLYKIDKDGSNEDTYGWHYKSGEYELLIIND